jgi:hypothetical protein
VLVVNFIDVFTTCGVSFVGESHFHLLSFFVEDERVDVDIGVAVFLSLFATTGAVLLG